VDREKYSAKEHSLSEENHRLLHEITALQRERDHSEKSGLKSSIFNYAWHLQKNGRAKSTIHTVIDRLNRLSKICDIQNPEELKTTLAKINWSNNTKRNIAIILSGYLRFIGKEWTPPTYKPTNKLPFIPTEQEIDSLISASRPTIATLLQFLKETGVRIGEALRVKWFDIDLERRTAHITPEKYSNPRILPLSYKLVNMINRLPRKTDFVFAKNYKTIRETYRYLRNKTAKKLQNPRLKKITFHTFRHWKGTIEYHKTKDVIHVKNILGHKEIKSTMTYINLESAIFLNSQDEFITRTAKTVEEACKLLEVGFDYVTEMNGIKIFRKRQ
jgi:integrase